MIFFPRLKPAWRAIFRARSVFFAVYDDVVDLDACSRGLRVDLEISRYSTAPLFSFGINAPTTSSGISDLEMRLFWIKRLVKRDN